MQNDSNDDHIQHNECLLIKMHRLLKLWYNHACVYFVERRFLRTCATQR